MTLIISLSALLVSVFFIQFGTGALGPLDALAGQANGFTALEIGLLGSSHYIGLLAGCIVYPYLIRRSGHSRTFAMTASASAISALLHPLFIDVGFWCLLRVLAGFSIAGAYTVIESWLQAKLDNENRGRAFGVYRVAEMTGAVLAQGVIALLDPATYAAYTFVAIVACMSLLPLALTQSAPPELPDKVGFAPLFAFKLSPLAGLGVMTAGMSNSAFRMVGPVYGVETGLSTADIAVFLIVGVLGGGVAQLPAGYVADRFNRRHVLVGFSSASLAVCLSFGLLGSAGFAGVGTAFAMAFLYGAAAMPIHSISTAHANDFARPGDLLQLSASLIFLFSAGAITSPIMAGFLIESFNPGAMFLFVALIHLILIGYSFWRMGIRPALSVSSYRYVPRTSLFIGFILRSRTGRGPGGR